jgi:hypothetical protein
MAVRWLLLLKFSRDCGYPIVDRLPVAVNVRVLVLGAACAPAPLAFLVAWRLFVVAFCEPAATARKDSISDRRYEL